ncbi:hypothetical protein ACO0LB_01395 [Undibacterium sp. SXout7W]|uniref:hypothetical protein n=1 Tax=Undibacterium sp. SXout7W TaxID=3413049 RepID=UPI003BF02AB9
MSSTKTIWLHPQAPMKPELGQSCNGCGVCCAAEPCPVARVFLWQYRGACRALIWNADHMRYQCGMLIQPAYYLRWLPLAWQYRFSQMINRWIAAGIGCDSDAEVAIAPSSEPGPS